MAWAPIAATALDGRMTSVALLALNAPHGFAVTGSSADQDAQWILEDLLADPTAPGVAVFVSAAKTVLAVLVAEGDLIDDGVLAAG